MEGRSGNQGVVVGARERKTLVLPPWTLPVPLGPLVPWKTVGTEIDPHP